MLRERLNEALKEALLSKKSVAVRTIRLILAALKDRDIIERGKGNMSGLSEEQILSLLQSMVKQRRESMRLYEEAGRTDLAHQEAEEIAVIEGFLPPRLGEDEMKTAIAEVIEELGATSLKEMGRVMGALKQRYSGRMDFAKAGAIVKERLS